MANTARILNFDIWICLVLRNWDLEFNCVSCRASLAMTRVRVKENRVDPFSKQGGSFTLPPCYCWQPG
jgi:hypothetical protein